MEKIINGKIYESVDDGPMGCEYCDLLGTSLCIGDNKCYNLIGYSFWKLKKDKMGKNEIKEITGKLSDIVIAIDKIKDEIGEWYTTNITVESKEKFITVTDGWRGPLKLKECWVRDEANDEWLKLEDVELLARDDKLRGRYGVICNGHSYRQYTSYKHLKFRPFSIENPPPIDWPLISKSWDRDDNIRYFAGYSGENGLECGYHINGRTSETSEGIGHCNHPIFLNIEPVED